MSTPANFNGAKPNKDKVVVITVQAVEYHSCLFIFCVYLPPI